MGTAVAAMNLEAQANVLECVKGFGYLPATDAELAALAEMYCNDDGATNLTDALTAEKCLHADVTVNWHTFHACLLNPAAPGDGDGADPNNCPCHATMLKTFGTGAIMVLLWNML